MCFFFFKELGTRNPKSLIVLIQMDRWGAAARWSGTYFSNFHDFRNWAQFSLHIWIMQWILQPLITYGIITIIKIKTPLCGQTPCICYKGLRTNIYVCLDFVTFDQLPLMCFQISFSLKSVVYYQVRMEFHDTVYALPPKKDFLSILIQQYKRSNPS